LLGNEQRDRLTPLLNVRWPGATALAPLTPEQALPTEPPIEARLALLEAEAQARRYVRRALGQVWPEPKDILLQADFQRACDEAFDALRQAASWETATPPAARSAALDEVLPAFAVEIHIGRIKAHIAKELNLQLVDMAKRLNGVQQKAGDGWLPEIDGAPLLYTHFKPKLWQAFESEWRACAIRVNRIRAHVCRIVAAEVLLEENCESC
jgi:hypothetical protein